MKNSRLTLACLVCALTALLTPCWALIGDGRGIFCVIVELQEAETGNLIDGAKLALSDSGYDDLVKDPKLKRYLPLFAPSRTNLAGQTCVYYFGGFSFETNSGQTQGVRGRLTITKEGYQDVTVELSKIIGPSLKTDDKSLPRAQLTMKKR